MSDEEKSLGDDLKDKANEAAKEVEETAKEFADEAKEAAKEIKETWNEATSSGENKKMLAGILAIVVGGLGIHKFILGYNQEGILQILLSFLCGIGGIIGIIEGIIYLTKSDEEFYQTYQVGKKPWF
ncbi:MAG: NINE protein [Flavobacteriaceae bacterium]|nr:NINE protein [Flavobacteriaceae bacterium]